MPTIDSKAIIDQLIANNGIYNPGDDDQDPPVHSIYEYTNNWGNVAYGVNYGERNNYVVSPFVHNPKLIWSLQK